MKQAVIAPSMMYLLYPLQGELEGYSRGEFINDLINEVSRNARFIMRHCLILCGSVKKTFEHASRQAQRESRLTSLKVYFYLRNLGT